jgi:general secretion pathway protein A
MFLDFYKLRAQPFGETPDPRYLYLSPTHREALASLAYGIKAGRGFLALIAEPGMGKTTLLFHLLDWLRESAHTVFVFQTQCGSRDLLRYVLGDLGIDTEGKPYGWMQEQLKEIVITASGVGKRLVLFIDEAQNLRESVLETVRLLSDFENPSSKLIQIILAGQPQLADKLARPEMEQLRQRISILSRLRPFTPSETEIYINHRLRLVGAEGRKLFTPEARARIADWSRGIPRNINNLCFNALTLACALGKQEVDDLVITEVASDLKLYPMVRDRRSLQPNVRGQRRRALRTPVHPVERSTNETEPSQRGYGGFGAESDAACRSGKYDEENSSYHEGGCR